MKVINNIFDEFVYGGHLLSLGGACIVWSVIILLNLPFSWQILLISYLIPQIIYSYNHYKETKEDIETNPERVKHLQKIINNFPYFFGFYALFLLIILILFTNQNIFLFVILLIIFGLLYTVYFKKLTNKIVCFKNIYISIFWALGIFITIFYYPISFNYFFILFFLFIFLRLLTNTIFFDIKDIKSDKNKKLKTLPVLIGKEKTLKFLHIINIFSFSPILIGMFTKIIPFFAIILLLFYFYSLYYIKKTNKSSSYYLRKISYVMVDGEYILWPILLILAK